MRLRSASAGLGLLLATALCGAAAAQVQTVIRDCVARLPAVPVGLPALEQRCPALQGALQEAGIRPLLIESSRMRLYRDSLRQLERLAHPPAGPAPSRAALDPILRTLRPPTAPARSWWQRLWEWLAAHLAGRQQQSSPWLNGLGRLLGRVHWLWIAVIWGTVIALPIAAAIIVVREIRALGRRSRDQVPTAPPGRGPARAESQLALLRQAPPAERPARLFSLLVTRLVAAGRLPPDRSLTHREVVRAVQLDDAQQRHLLESLARASERQLYAAHPTQPAGLEELLARAEDLYTVGWSQR